MHESATIPYHKLIDESALNDSTLNGMLPLDIHQVPFDRTNMYNNRKMAIICINLFTILQFTFMMGSKYVMATYSVNALDYVFVRTIGCLLVHSISLFVIYKKNWRFPQQDFAWVMTRNAAGTVVIIGLVFAMQYLPMGIYQIIYNTMPFWAGLLAFVILNESLKKVEMLAMVFSFTLIMLLFISRSQTNS